MYIIDQTFFQREKEIANIKDTNTKVLSELEQFIDEKGRLFMLDVFTVDQVQEFEGYLVNGLLPNDPLTIPLKWRNLVYGCDYTRDNVKHKWLGLCVELGTYKDSLLADYVYYFYIQFKNSYMSGVGESKGNPKGAIVVNSTQRLVTTWNNFVKKYQSDRNGNIFKPYGRWFNYNFCYPILFDYSRRNNENVSLLQFVTDHPEDYPDVNPRFYSIQNQLGV